MYKLALLVALLSLLLIGCASTYEELRTAELSRFHEQQSTWELYDLDTGKQIDVKDIKNVSRQSKAHRD